MGFLGLGQSNGSALESGLFDIPSTIAATIGAYQVNVPAGAVRFNLKSDTALYFSLTQAGLAAAATRRPVAALESFGGNCAALRAFFIQPQSSPAAVVVGLSFEMARVPLESEALVRAV